MWHRIIALGLGISLVVLMLVILLGRARPTSTSLGPALAFGPTTTSTAGTMSGSEQKTAMKVVAPFVEATTTSSITATFSTSTLTLSNTISTATGNSSMSGQLLMLDRSLYPEHQLALYDMAARETKTLFRVPENGWIYQFDLSPDGTRIALAYAAPPEEPQKEGKETTIRQPYDRSGIYLLSLTEPDKAPENVITNKPQLIFGNHEANTYFFNPIWSADGQSIYYISYKRLIEINQPPDNGEADDENLQENGQAASQNPTLDVALYRYDLTSGVEHFVMQDAIWPRLSPDGKHLVYIQVAPATSERGIYLLDTESGDVSELVEINRFFDVDTPHFSPDGEWVYFGGVTHSTKVSRGWWEILLDVKVAHAHTDHNMPSDWWRVSIHGGEPEQLTSTRRIVSYGDFGSDGQSFVSATNTGVYLMSAEGEYLERLPLPNLYQFVILVQ